MGGVAAMDPAVVTAVIAALAAVTGPPITWAVTKRRESAATVELTEEQAEQIRGQVWRQLNDDLRAEIARLQARVADLEARIGALDLTLRERGAELAGVAAERDRLRVRLAARPRPA